MKFNITRYAVILLLLFTGFNACQAAPILELRVNSGEFHMGPTFTAGGPVPFEITDNTYNLITDFPTTIGWDTTAGFNSAQPGSIAAFNFGGPYVNTFSVDCDPQVVDDCINNPHSAFSGTVNGGNSTIADGNAIVVDTPSFYANWNGVNFNQGGTSGSGTAYPDTPVEFPFDSTVTNVNSTTGTFDYSMTWQSLIIGGPFNGQTGTWTFIGTGRVDLTAPSNLPATEPGLTLSANNFAPDIIVQSSTMDMMFPLPTTHDACTTCWDFMVTNLAANGDSAKVVIPLNSAIVAGAEILKYNTTTMTWPVYDTTIDTVSSAASVGGLCPVAGDIAFVSPPQVGHDCLQLDSTDGLANDDDGNANSVLVDPAGIFLPRAAKQITPLNDGSACSLTNPEATPAHAAEWLLLVGFLVWLGMKRCKSN